MDFHHLKQLEQLEQLDQLQQLQQLQQLEQLESSQYNVTHNCDNITSYGIMDGTPISAIKYDNSNKQNHPANSCLFQKKKPIVELNNDITNLVCEINKTIDSGKNNKYNNNNTNPKKYTYITNNPNSDINSYIDSDSDSDSDSDFDYNMDIYSGTNHNTCLNTSPSIRNIALLTIVYSLLSTHYVKSNIFYYIAKISANKANESNFFGIILFGLVLSTVYFTIRKLAQIN